MAARHTIRLTDGTTANTISFEYDADSQADYRQRYINQRRELGLVPQLHTPDASTSGPEPTSYSRNNREWIVDMAVHSTGRDDQLNNLNKLGRKALNSSDAGIGAPITRYYLEVQLENATNWTRFPVKWADIIDDSGIYSYTSGSSAYASAPVAYPIRVLIVTEPIGYGDTETLKNYLKTPHFLEDVDDDGLADDWTEIGTPTTTLDTDTYYCGGQSQKVVTDTAGDDGIASATIAITGAPVIIASVAIIKSSGDAVKMELLTDSTGSLDSVTTATAADETRTGADGNSWGIYHLTGTAALADTTVQLRVYRPTAGAVAATTYYVDRCYVDIDGGSISDTELLTNGDFETYTGTQDGGADGTFSGWTLSGTGSGDIAEPTATIYGSGTNAVKLTRVADGCILFQNITVVPDTIYRLQLYCRGDGSADGRINVYDSTNSADITGVTATGVTGTSYTLKNYMWTAPAGCVSARIYLYTNAAGVCYWDHVSVKAVTVKSLPTAWSSYYTVTNHYDAHSGHIDYIDYCDIPGDQPAPTRFVTGSTTTYTATGYAYWHIGAHDSNPEGPRNYIEQYSGAGADDRLYATVSVSSAWTKIAQFNSLMTAADWSGMKGDYVIHAAVNDQDTAVGELKARIVWGNNEEQTYFDTTAVQMADFQKWILETLGPVNLSWPDALDSDDTQHYISVMVYAKHAANTANVYVDFVRLMPAGAHHYGIAEIRAVSGRGFINHVFDGGLAREDEDIWIVNRQGYLESTGVVMGHLPRLRPNMLNRVQFAVRQLQSDDATHATSLSSGLGQITTRYRPRTTTLLGTL